MLNDSNVMANVAVKDLRAARGFYEGTLGLEIVDRQGEEALVLRSAQSALIVYRSQYAGTNQATAATWQVADVAAEVRELKGKRVEFLHYDMPGAQLDGDVHRFGEHAVAWFKDPEGNVLSIVGR
jgi:catechol 2,3-dioxygenase-like lactoylglutathione lyase family enzyme